ncbi:MAG: hypothetical protein K5634_03155 [Sphaerochaetaceae bacterium]|nr:hypothetical protein [Sphaerochaetaceae bacterium]
MSKINESLIKYLSVVLVCLLFFCACSQEPSSTDSITFSSEFKVFMKNSKKTIQNKYESGYFREDSGTFNKDLALLSFSLAAAPSVENGAKSLNSMKFENLEQFTNDDSNVNGCSYVMGHRKVDDKNLVAVFICGLNYSVEWAGNFTLGESGNHEGFDTAAGEIYSDLKNYLTQYCPQGNIKLWITGYSRAAAIADILAVNIIENGEIEVSQKDIFAYAFAPPASVSGSEDYSCIQNIFVDSDVVPAVPPATQSSDYGLTMPGVEIKMSSTPDNLNECLHTYVGSDVDMPEFTADDSYSTPAEFLEYFVNGITSATEDTSAASFESREKYYSTVQTRLVYLTEILMKNNAAGLSALKDYITKNKDQLAVLAFQWTIGDGFYESLYPLLDSCGTEYDSTELKNACSILPSIRLNTNLVVFGLGFVSDSEKAANAMYIVYCHYPEVCYALLKDYN